MSLNRSMQPDKTRALSNASILSAEGAPLFEAAPSAQRIFVRDLQVSCRIGLSEEERQNRQRLAIHLDLEIEPRRVTKDQISEVVDYTNLLEDMRRICQDCEFRLLESLAERLAAACFLHERVLVVRVRIEKLDLVPEAAGVGIEIEHRRSQGSRTPSG